MTRPPETGVTSSWSRLHGTTYRGPGRDGSHLGESDSSGCPRPERQYPGAWPMLVTDAGVSRPYTRLVEDMEWCFSASERQVKIVLLVKFDYSQHTIHLERRGEAYASRTGATMTQSASGLQPVSQQPITITKNTTANLTSCQVTGSALVLTFRLLFLRNPGPHKGDIVISIPKLEDYAGAVWNFAPPSALPP